MARGKKDTRCPAETTLGIIGGKWKLLILRELLSGASRFSELRRRLSGISEKMLAQHLRELESDGIIARRIYPEVPPKVEYSLTASGKTLKPIIDGLHEWGLEHLIRQEGSLTSFNQALIKRVVRLSCEAGLEDWTAEARRTRSKEFLMKKFSDLCELCASAVNTSSQKYREQQNRTERSRC